ncbi:hypothetical protein A3197_17425 [Candidatus Thiodiazotropha endoloripes]|nr:hypothetical protein A3197_17425 [Candidatus Thiodiazotropha endoloripes]
MVSQIAKDELLDESRALLDDLTNQSIIEGSLEWYLNNNLRLFIESIEQSGSAKEIVNAARTLSRFCTESMDWETDLYLRCANLIESGFRLGKT